MEQKFLEAWKKNRENAARMGVRMRPVENAEGMKTAHRCVSGHRVSDGFDLLAD